MSKTDTDSSQWASTNKQNTRRLGIWTFLWVLSMAVATFGPRFIWDYASLPSVLAVGVNLAIGIGMIIANIQYFQGLDELNKKIFLDAGALTLGVGLVGGLGYELMETVRLISFEPAISHLAILMSLTFLVGMLIGHRKYQ